MKPPFTALQRTPLSPLQCLQPPPALAQGFLSLPLGAAGLLSHSSQAAPWVLLGVSHTLGCLWGSGRQHHPGHGTGQWNFAPSFA